MNSNASLLSDKKILEEYKNKNIVIDPFNKEQLKTSSYDVTLGKWFFRQQRKDLLFYNPWDKQHVESVWGDPNEACAASSLFGNNLPKGINKDQLIIVVHPRELILAHTEEFIGGKNQITTMMKARSSMGRNGISVCKCAGWGDVGYINRWTMEIENSLSYPVILLVGQRVAQITFFYVGPILQSGYEKTGKYQTESELSSIKNNWTPKALIPKLWKDLEY